MRVWPSPRVSGTPHLGEGPGAPDSTAPEPSAPACGPPGGVSAPDSEAGCMRGPLGTGALLGLAVDPPRLSFLAAANSHSPCEAGHL
ncbi:hypothetical protein VULLAG_LOCUS5771 [Vulpes lagopus]